MQQEGTIAIISNVSRLYFQSSLTGTILKAAAVPKSLNVRLQNIFMIPTSYN